MTSTRRASVLAILFASLWCAVAAAQPAANPGRRPPAPPSTGREMPKQERPDLTPEQAAQVIAEAIKLSARDGECNKVVGLLLRALPYSRLDRPETLRAAMALQRCSIKAKRWSSVIVATEALLQLDPAKASPDEMIRAMVELGQYPRAEAKLKELLKKYPGSARELTAALTLMLCRQELWAKCAKTARAALDALAASKIAEGDEAMLKNRVIYAQALIGIGDLPGYSAERATLVKALGARATPILEPFDASAQAVAQRKMWLRVTPAKMLPLGTYHLMGKPETGVMATVRMLNHDKRERSFRLETEVQGATERSVRSFKLGRGKAMEITATPPLSLDFDVVKIRARRPAQLAIKLVETTGGKEQIWIDETPQVDVLPRDHLPLMRYVGGDHAIWTREYLAAWITPNIKPVEELLTKAKERVARRAFVGEQAGTWEQVKALYDELQARGVSYVMDPSVDDESLMMQRTRLPAEVLASTNAQCLEGTLLFATLLESIGLRPIVVTVPGHAFVGWHTVAKDKVLKQMFIETTMVGSASFEDAVKVATSRVLEEDKKGNVKNGSVRLIDVASLRKQGYSAQPYE